MKIFFGNYREKAAEEPKMLRMRFSMENLAFKWEACGQTADFTGNYLQNILTPEKDGPALSEETIAAVKYVVNELIENAVKFRDGGDITFACGISGDEIVFLIANAVNESRLPALASAMENLSNGDVGAMLLERIESNAASETHTGSGLGYLTMINDYGAKLGWKIEKGEKGNILFKTMVFLKIKNNITEVENMELKGTGYNLFYDEKTGEAFFKGTFRCSNEEYAEIGKMMDKIIQGKPAKLILDLKEMEFLNSSGINMLAKLVISMRNKGDTALEMRGNNKFPWQGKSLPNLKKLYPAMALDIK